MKILAHVSAKKKTKWLSNFAHLLVFSSNIIAVKGLIFIISGFSSEPELGH